MASVNETLPTSEEPWNEAYDRLESFLKTFELADHAYVSQLAVDIFRQARDRHHEDPSRNPTALTIEQAQKRLANWLATNLDGQNKSPADTLPAGTIALLLSQVYQTAPTAFLANPVPEELRQALRETLLVTGPDLNVSSMTPRHLDYGPMLQLARQTWHKWNVAEIVIAFAFWAGVYSLFYWWLSQSL
jgi:hypothetical protein